MADDAGEDPDLNDDVGKLMQAYINEKCAPSILPYATELIGIMIDMIELQVRLQVRPRRSARTTVRRARQTRCARHVQSMRANCWQAYGSRARSGEPLSCCTVALALHHTLSRPQA